MRVYISGKIGEEVLSDATREKFARAEKELEAKGYATFNPAGVCWTRRLVSDYDGEQHSRDIFSMKRLTSFYAYILMRDLGVLSECDAICLLPDWRQSPGAKAELAYAQAIGLKVYELSQYQTLEEWEPK